MARAVQLAFQQCDGAVEELAQPVQLAFQQCDDAAEELAQPAQLAFQPRAVQLACQQGAGVAPRPLTR